MKEMRSHHPDASALFLEKWQDRRDLYGKQKKPGDNRPAFHACLSY
jgi:hypothetical protein